MSSDTPSRSRAAQIRNYKYHEKLLPRERWTLYGCVGAILVGSVLIVTAVFSPSTVAPMASPGRLSSAHAAWENRCDACHEPWTPISRGRLPGTAADRCETCHGGTEHYTNQPRNTNTCAGCHPEHRGHDTKLARPPDGACRACHAGTDFATNHPEFSSLAGFDPHSSRRLKFSHAVHLSPGMALAGEKQSRRYTLADIPDKDTRERQKRKQSAADLNALTELACAACHQLQVGDEAGPAPARTDGRYFVPVRFDAHCRGCHPLAGFDAQKPELTVPHGRAAGDLHEFLRGALAAELLKTGDPLEPLPPPARLDRPPILDPALKAQFDHRVATAERALRTSGKGCAKCHLLDAGRNVNPVQPKQVWLERATFSHRAHRAAECRVCHAGAYPAPGPGAKLIELEPALVGGLDDCRRCHAPAAEKEGNSVGGADRSCSACHIYHGAPLHRGPTDPIRDPRKRLDVPGFLHGKPGTR